MAEVIFTVTAENRAYSNCPMYGTIKPGTLPGKNVALIDERGVIIPAQVDGDKLHWILPHIAQGQTKKLAVTTADIATRVNLVEKDETIAVNVGEEHFTTFHYGKKWVRPFLDPVMGPSGPVNRRFPMETIEGEAHDHPHHKGCWVAHGDVNGVDIWCEMKEFGRTVHQKFVSKESGPVFAKIATENEWTDHSGKRLMSESREYRFYNQPTSARSFDLMVTFKATDGDVTFGDTKEGGICSFRVATSMDVPKPGKVGGRFVTGTGAINEKEGWGKRAPWCDYTGPVNGATVGVAIFDTPGNFRYPTYWHVRNYGLMTANPFGLSYYAGNPGGEPNGTIVIKSGESMTYRYRVMIHAGDTNDAHVGDAFHHYINPPTVSV